MRLAVGPWAVWFGPQLPDACLSGCFSKQLRSVGRSVVDRYTLDPDVVTGILGERPFEKDRRILAADGGMLLKISEARSIIDGDMQMILADPAFAVSPVVGDLVSDAV